MKISEGKKIILHLLFLIVLLGCEENDRKKLTVEFVSDSVDFINEQNRDTLILNEITSKGLFPLDTIIASNTSKSTFYLSSEKSKFYFLSVSPTDASLRQQIKLLISREDKNISLEIPRNEKGSLKLTGSEEGGKLIVLQKEIDEHLKEINKLKSKLLKSQYSKGQDAVNVLKIKEIYIARITEYENYLKKMAKKLSPSLVAFYTLSTLSNLSLDQHMPFIDSLFPEIIKKYPTNEHVLDFSEIAERSRKLLPGGTAPAFMLPTPTGDSLSLSSLQGKYVLLDFWASWCKPCRMENPHLVDVYKKFKGDKFEILGISLDRNNDSWVKAIEKDNLTWLQVSDLKHWGSYPAKLYRIQSIPSNYLLDPKGKIIGINLRGIFLDQKLEEIFG